VRAWRRRGGAGSPVEGVICGGAEAAGLRTRIARSPASACWRFEQQPSRQRYPNKHGESPKKKQRTLAIARARPTAIWAGTRVRFAGTSKVRTTHCPPARSSAPPSARPPARGILRRTRLERQQGGLDRVSTPTARSSRAVVAARPLAVNEGRPLSAGRWRPSL
jgi:hypothetical protein